MYVDDVFIFICERIFYECIRICESVYVCILCAQDDLLTWRLALDVAAVLDKARQDAGIVFPADLAKVKGKDKP